MSSPISASSGQTGTNTSVAAAPNATNQAMSYPAYVTAPSIHGLPVVPSPSQLLASPHLMDQIARMQTITSTENARRFVALNPIHFPRDVGNIQQAQAQANRVLTLRVDGGVKIFIDDVIINESQFLRMAFNANMQEGLTGIMNLEGHHSVWITVVLAMCGVNIIPIGLIRDNASLMIIEAMVKADYILATQETKVNVTVMLSAHFATFQNWKTVPVNRFTINIHENKAIEINEAWKAYRNLPGSIYKPFTEYGFALGIAICCSGQVFERVHHLFDSALIRSVSVASITGRNGLPATAAAKGLFQL